MELVSKNDNVSWAVQGKLSGGEWFSIYVNIPSLEEAQEQKKNSRSSELRIIKIHQVVTVHVEGTEDTKQYLASYINRGGTTKYGRTIYQPDLSSAVKEAQNYTEPGAPYQGLILTGVELSQGITYKL